MGEDEEPAALSAPRDRASPIPPSPGKDVVEDARHMARALELAKRGWGRVSPNPLVGAVCVQSGDHVVGEGWHEGPGSPHAEAMALAEAGTLARGSTLYCTLEPCAHQGRTPPCVDAIIGARVARVVACMADPHPIVDGRGLAALAAAGIQTELGLMQPAAARLNESYVRAVRTGRPFVVLKMAATLDGKVAARDGSSRWITGEAARVDAHRLRAWADAIVVGAGTALDDDPSLTVRGVAYGGAPVLRVLVDARGRVSARRRMFDDAAPTLVATTEDAPVARRREWEAAGAEVDVLDASDDGVSLDALLESLGKREVQGALLEGGPSLAWSAIAAGAVDKVVLYVAPMLVGGRDAPGILGGTGLAPIGEAMRAEIHDVELIDGDLRVEAYVHGDR